jgi:alpha-ribazole phosphatase
VDVKWLWVRHGSTVENEKRCYLGHLDAPLSLKGEAQVRQFASKLAEKLVDKPLITQIYTSDLVRCRQTAKIISQTMDLLVDPIPVEALREINFGDWDGKTYEQLMQLDPIEFSRWISNPYDHQPPKGETLWEMGKRVDHWLMDLMARQAEDETIMLVSHGGPIRWFQSKWLRGNAKHFWDVTGLPHGRGSWAHWDGQTWGMDVIS